MKILHVVGTRPNFMKIAPIMREMAKSPQEFEQILVHTGQHYDENMSKVFIDELELPHPDMNLDVGSGSHARQTAQIMHRFEPVLLDYVPEWVIVPGDVNSTLACTLVASKLGFKVAHIEAGLRSFDRTMPEEINRLVTDQLANLLFTPSSDADENLRHEGIASERIHFVGNIMIDTLVNLLPKAEVRWPRIQDKYGFDHYVLVTLHRPSNVDNIRILSEIMGGLYEISQTVPVVFPVHPRTRRRISEIALQPNNRNLRFEEPTGYLEFLALEAHADLVITDSGGIQEETTYLGVPCLTVRPNTERPITIVKGTNQLVKSEKTALLKAAQHILNHRDQTPSVNISRPELWDGKTAERIVRIFRGAMG